MRRRAMALADERFAEAERTVVRVVAQQRRIAATAAAEPHPRVCPALVDQVRAGTGQFRVDAIAAPAVPALRPGKPPRGRPPREGLDHGGRHATLSLAGFGRSHHDRSKLSHSGFRR